MEMEKEVKNSMDDRTYKRYGLNKNEPIVRRVGFSVIVESPARSPKGNIRNIKAMTDVKLIHLAKKMNERAFVASGADVDEDPDTRWRDVDPEAWHKVLAEGQARGYSLA